MQILVGTSGFSYKEWKGSFYPEDLKNADMLRYYAERFSSVEINNTFYRMPKASMLEGWAGQVPSDFLFVLKASQQITHRKRLKEAGEPLAYLLETASTLGEQAGSRPVPAAALLQEGSATTPELPRAAARGAPLRFRVPPRVVGRR